jgi:hypothetical protein
LYFLFSFLFPSSSFITRVERPFADQGPVGEHPESGWSISFRCSFMYL